MPAVSAAAPDPSKPKRILFRSIGLLPCFYSTVVRSVEHPVSLQVDDLPGLRGRERDRILPALMGVGANELMRLHALGGVFLDRAGGLKQRARPIRGRPDAVALVLDRRLGRSGVLARAAGKARPCCLEFCEHPKASADRPP